jgi:hypothetical protein
MTMAIHRASPDHDQAGHVFRVPTQEDNSKDEHQNGTDHPVLHKRKAEYLSVPKDFGEFFVPHLRERRVHHDDQSDRDWDRSCTNAETIQKWHDSRNEPAETDP